jgi:AraC-like DNA-binding protein
MTSLIRGTALLKFSALVSSLGGEPEEMMRARGVDPAVAGDYERFLSSAAAAALVADAAEALDCPDFGMRLACEQGIESLGPLVVVIRNAETVAAAVDGVSRYLHSIAPDDRVELIRGKRSGVLTFRTGVRQVVHHDQWVEKGLGVAMDTFRVMLGQDFVPLRVTMQHPRVAPLASYRDVFGCPIEFESELNSMHLPNHALTQPIRGRDAAALALAEKYLAGIAPDLVLVDHVRDLTRRLLALDQASLVVVARAMSLHPRVLQRRLAESGTTFEEIRDDVRRELAWQLSATGMPVSAIASELGYFEQSSYTRACRRWYGESPRQLRARRRSSLSNFHRVPTPMDDS